MTDVIQPDTHWRLVGGRACLDFVNTVGGRISGPDRRKTLDFADRITRDDIPDYESLVRWSAFASLVGPSAANRMREQADRSPATAKRVLARARRLREGLYRIGKAVLEDWPLPAADLEVLDHEVREARQRQHLVARARRVETEWIPDPTRLDSMLGPVALSAAELFGSEDVGQLKQCGGAACGWLFIDTTRNHSRQWCEMADCGNLAKVRRFRQRQRRRPAKRP